ncbi:hypothetical protein EC515_01160 [Helicobacter pylori]|nr:hypothetical protein EC515_01160 [Helicobacter pylori]
MNSPTRAKINAVDSSIKNSLNSKLLLYQKRVVIFKKFFFNDCKNRVLITLILQLESDCKRLSKLSLLD